MNEDIDVYGYKLAHVDDEVHATLASCFRLTDVIAKAHEKVEHDHVGDFIECLHLVCKFGVHRVEPLQKDNHGGGDSILASDLTPKQVIPHDNCGGENYSSDEERCWDKQNNAAA